MITIVFMFETLIAFFPRPLIPLLNENVGNHEKLLVSLRLISDQCQKGFERIQFDRFEHFDQTLMKR